MKGGRSKLKLCEGTASFACQNLTAWGILQLEAELEVLLRSCSDYNYWSLMICARQAKLKVVTRRTVQPGILSRYPYRSGSSRAYLASVDLFFNRVFPAAGAEQMPDSIEVLDLMSYSFRCMKIGPQTSCSVSLSFRHPCPQPAHARNLCSDLVPANESLMKGCRQP